MAGCFEDVKKRARDYIVSRGIFSVGDRVLCALSGGADSVALLLIIKELEAELGITVLAAHFNHGIRGDEAFRDENFCRRLCRENGIVFLFSSADVPLEAKKSGQGIEECARRLRYAFLQSAAKESGCNKIATAHHADDNIETVLLHMIRGCGLGGLAGILPVRENIVRPLLPFRKSELVSVLNERGVSYVYDSTNGDLHSARNYIRHKILPEIYKLNPRADAVFFRMCESLAQDSEYIENSALRVSGNAGREELCCLPDAVLKRYIKNRFEKIFGNENCPQLDSGSLTLIAQAVKKGKGTAKYDIPGDVTVYIDSKGIWFEKRSPGEKTGFSIPLEIGENIISSIGYRILITTDKKVAEEWQNIYKLSILRSVNFDRISKDGQLDVYVRNRLPGDEYKFGGFNRCVRKQLINYKIPQYKRKKLPCFCTENKLFLVHGFPVADDFIPCGQCNTAYILCCEEQ